MEMGTELNSNEGQMLETTAQETALSSADSVEASFPDEQSIKKSRKKRKWIKRLIILIVLVVVVVVAVYLLRGFGGGQEASGATYTEYTVERRDITEMLSGSGALEPADSYTVTTLIEGEVLAANFEEGDIVEKDTELYLVDGSDISTSIERAQLTLSQARTNYQRKLENQDKLSVKATTTGSVTSIDVEVGDNVVTGQRIASIVDSSTMTIILPFPADDAAGFYVGQSASVTLEGSFETLYGAVTKISGTDTVLTGNMIVRQVTIEVSNPGALSGTQTATAMINGAACSASSTFTYKNEAVVTAETSGKVSRLNVSEGDWISKNQTVVTLTSDTLADEIQSAYNSVRDAEISLENQYDRLDSYSITSPIKGTIIEKNYKEGDTIAAGKILCTVYDLTYLSFTMNVDELDISTVEVGQTVEITADAVAGKTFKGVVTKINIQGITSGGVTSYPVTVRIDETEGLLPGMNVNAEILIQNSENVVAVPIAAVSRGNRVLVKTGEGNVANIVDGIPEGFTYVEVVTGVSDGDFVEITEGLSEGDMIAYIMPTVDGSSGMMFFGGQAMGAGGGEMVVMESSGGGPAMGQGG